MGAPGDDEGDGGIRHADHRALYARKARGVEPTSASSTTSPAAKPSVGSRPSSAKHDAPKPVVASTVTTAPKMPPAATKAEARSLVRL